MTRAASAGSQTEPAGSFLLESQNSRKLENNFFLLCFAFVFKSNSFSLVFDQKLASSFLTETGKYSCNALGHWFAFPCGILNN